MWIQLALISVTICVSGWWQWQWQWKWWDGTLVCASRRKTQMSVHIAQTYIFVVTFLFMHDTYNYMTQLSVNNLVDFVWKVTASISFNRDARITKCILQSNPTLTYVMAFVLSVVLIFSSFGNITINEGQKYLKRSKVFIRFCCDTNLYYWG